VVKFVGELAGLSARETDLALRREFSGGNAEFIQVMEMLQKVEKL
jgi:hypothetical protein